MSAVQRVAMISVHTSPLSQPGTGDAGGLNVYVVETAKEMARRGVEVDIFTRRTRATDGDVVELARGVAVHHVIAGPYDGLAKEDLPGQLCAFTAGIMRELAMRHEGYYDVVHSHYWLSGQVGWLAAERWGVPLVHTMHTMAKVKNAHRAEGDALEPPGRVIGEEQVVEIADRLVANTTTEGQELVDLYGADPEKIAVVPPGVDLETFRPGDRAEARRHLGVPDDAVLLLFVGRIQPLKAPDVLVRAAAVMVEQRPELRDRLVVAVLGGASGTGLAEPDSLTRLAGQLGIVDIVQVAPPVARTELPRWFQASDLVAVPSHNESFGLVAVEAAASGAVVVAADRGGLPAAVGDGGVLVDGHDPRVWATTMLGLLDDPQRRQTLGARAAERASTMGWDRTADELLEVYEDAVVRAQAAETRRAP